MTQKHKRNDDRLIGCRDLAGHRRRLIVFNDRGRVVLVNVTGEWAVLTPHQVGQLRAALRDVLLTA